MDNLNNNMTLTKMVQKRYTVHVRAYNGWFFATFTMIKFSASEEKNYQVPFIF